MSSSSSSDAFSAIPMQQRRLHKELARMVTDPPLGVSMDNQGEDLSVWNVKVQGSPGTLYEGETFNLMFKFGPKYPFESPAVVFTEPNIPVHPHVYSNGHICLSILSDDWSPALTVAAVCLSIISMLSSAKQKIRPPDNDYYIKNSPRSPKDTHWWYHDDTV